MRASPRIAVLGGAGQLGRALARAGGPSVIALGRAEADVTDPAALRSALASTRAEVVVNAAAYTAVDRAESEPQACFAVNRDGAGNVAAACAALGLPLIQVSSDYVFDGAKGSPYAEADGRNPLNAYGASKAAGEDLVLARHDRALVLRTAWLFGPDRPNFVRTVLGVALSGLPLRVVSDQIGSPTPAPGLAAIVLAIAQRLADGGETPRIVHAAGTPYATRHDVAAAAVAAVFPPQARPALLAVPSHAHPTPARRPADSRLDCALLAQALGLTPPDWARALPRLAAAIAAQEAERVAASPASQPPRARAAHADGQGPHRA